MISNNWKYELNQMLDSFANQAESTLEKIKQEFKAMDRAFDEDFRQYFLKISNLRLDLSYTKIAMNNWEERQIQVEHCNHSTQENHTHQVMANPGASTRCNENTNNQMDDLKLSAENDDGLLVTIKNENRNDFIEIIDSDDECDLVQSERQKTMTQNEVWMHESIGGGTNGDDKTIKNNPDASVKREIKEVHLPFTTFDPRRNSDEYDAERCDTKPRPPTKQIQSKIKRTAGKRLNCKQCEYVTNNHTDLKKHQNVHVPEKSMGVARHSNNLYHCTLCVRQFTNIGHLSMHMKGSHKNRQYLFDCSRCKRQFVLKAEKDRHENQCNGRHYECHLCKVYVTTFKSKMQIHMRTHSGTRPFRCMVCDKSFHQKCTLRHHLKSIHGRFNH